MGESGRRLAPRAHGAGGLDDDHAVRRRNLATAQRGQHCACPQREGFNEEVAGISEGGSVVPRVRDDEQEQVDAAIELLLILSTQERLKIADPGLGRHTNPHAADVQQDVPRSLIPWTDGCLEPALHPPIDPDEETPDHCDMCRVPELSRSGPAAN